MKEIKRVFLAPRSNEQSYAHFKSTISVGIPYNAIKSHLDNEGKKILSKQSKVFAWGCVESLKSRWDKMVFGDYWVRL